MERAVDGTEAVLVSVILPVHNGADTLTEQLRALAGQAYAGEWELIVADNGSTDASLAIAESWTGRLPRLSTVDASQRRGSAAARNIGARHANGAWLLFCDADDVVGEGWLQAMADALGSSDLVAGGIDFGFLDPGPVPSTRGAAEMRGTYAYLPFAVSANMGVQATVFRDLGGFEEQEREADVDLSWRAQLTGYRFGHEPAALVHKRRRHGLRATWNQHLRYGLSDVVLYQRFRSAGMPRALPATLRTYAWLLRHSLTAVSSPAARETWVRVAARRTGRLLGSLRRRVVYL